VLSSSSSSGGYRFASCFVVRVRRSHQQVSTEQITNTSHLSQSTTSCNTTLESTYSSLPSLPLCLPASLFKLWIFLSSRRHRFPSSSITRQNALMLCVIVRECMDVACMRDIPEKFVVLHWSCCPLVRRSKSHGKNLALSPALFVRLFVVVESFVVVCKRQKREPSQEREQIIREKQHEREVCAAGSITVFASFVRSLGFAVFIPSSLSPSRATPKLKNLLTRKFKENANCLPSSSSSAKLYHRHHRRRLRLRLQQGV
jgi:hypothetical protein